MFIFSKFHTSCLLCLADTVIIPLNIRNITQIAGGDPEKKIYKMLEFAGDGWKELKAGKRNPDKVPDVADPWYTGNFDDTWRDVTAGCQGLLKFLL